VPKGAAVLTAITNVPGQPPAITINKYGKGRAIYLATPVQMPILAPLARSLYDSIGIERGPITPGEYSQGWWKGTRCV
jgi:beta-galactosidase